MEAQSDHGGVESEFWRFQTGSFRHLGLTPRGLVSYQKSPVRDSRRLTPIWFALLANIRTRKVHVEIFQECPDNDELAAFWQTAITPQKTQLGAKAEKVIVATSTVNDYPGLIDTIAKSDVGPVTMRASYKVEVHAARYFEEHLRDLMRHSLFREFKRWPELLPRIVTTYNEVVGKAWSNNPGVFEARIRADHVVDEALGEDPAAMAEKQFLEKRLAISSSMFVPGDSTDMYFCTHRWETPKVSLGYDWSFVFKGRRWSAPLHAVRVNASRFPNEPTPQPTAHGLILANLVVPEPAIPAELLSNMDQRKARPSGGIGLHVAALALAQRAWSIEDHYEWLCGLAQSWWRAQWGFLPSQRFAGTEGPDESTPDEVLSPELLALGFETTSPADWPRNWSVWNVTDDGKAVWHTYLGWRDLDYKASLRLGRADHDWRPLQHHGIIRVSWAADFTPTVVYERPYEIAHPYMAIEAAPSMCFMLGETQKPLLREDFIAQLTQKRPGVVAHWEEQKRRREERAAKRALKRASQGPALSES